VTIFAGRIIACVNFKLFNSRDQSLSFVIELGPELCNELELFVLFDIVVICCPPKYADLLV
jgi:hypothetical protein